MKLFGKRWESNKHTRDVEIQKVDEDVDVGYNDQGDGPSNVEKTSAPSRKRNSVSTSVHRQSYGHKDRRYGPRRWGLRKIMVVTGLCVACASIVGIAVGVPVSKTVRDKNNLQDKTPQVIGPSSFTGLVAIDDGQGISKLSAYFVDSNQAIRHANYTDRQWHGGSVLDTITVARTGVRPGSPIMALQYNSTVNGPELIWRVFYFDRNNILQESVYSNATKSGGWTVTLLGDGGYEGAAANNTGLTACVSDRWLGDKGAAGIRLFYGSRDGGVQEIYQSLNAASYAWQKGDYFPDASNEAGCECTNRGLSVLNLWTISKDQTMLNGKPTRNLTHYFKDFNTSATAPSHPTGQWAKTNVSYTGLHPQSALTVITITKNTTAINDRLAHFQLLNGTIRELSITGLAENTTITDKYWDVVIDGNETPKPRLTTKLASVILNTNVDDGQEIHLLYEADPVSVSRDTSGGKRKNYPGQIVDAVRTLTAFRWSGQTIPIG